MDVALQVTMETLQGIVFICILRKSSTVLSTPLGDKPKVPITSQNPLNNSYGFGPTK